MGIDLYTTGCPKCKVLERKLKESGISYIEHIDVDEMLDMGFENTPVLVVDDNTYDFSGAIKWIKEA